MALIHCRNNTIPIHFTQKGIFNESNYEKDIVPSISLHTHTTLGQLHCGPITPPTIDSFRGAI